jgi:hypothetical protein
MLFYFSACLPSNESSISYISDFFVIIFFKIEVYGSPVNSVKYSMNESWRANSRLIKIV